MMQDGSIRFISMVGLLLTGLMLIASAGCKPAQPSQLHAGGLDPDLHGAVQLAEEARANYEHRTLIMRDYYAQRGDIFKREWADKELANLKNAQSFTWAGLGELKPAPAENVTTGDETLLAENVVSARQEWISRMEALAANLQQRSMNEMARSVTAAVTRLDPVRTYMYVRAAEVPPETNRPTSAHPEAEALFEKGYRLFREGKGIIPGLSTSYDKERQAIQAFKELVWTHPDSTRIALAAYYIADIYKEYFDENLRALWWYERAWQWDPHVTEPARFQAATVCERVRDYPRAIDYYKASLEYDPPRLGNADFARRRLRELTEPKGQ